MSLFQVGRLCLKIAGRDAGKTCVVVEALNNNFVMIDGETRRRKVNVKHLEAVNKSIKIKSKASHAEIKTAFTKLGLKVLETKSKKAPGKPTKIRKVKLKVKKAVKKEEKPVSKIKKDKSKKKVSGTEEKAKKE